MGLPQLWKHIMLKRQSFFNLILTHQVHFETRQTTLNNLEEEQGPGIGQWDKHQEIHRHTQCKMFAVVFIKSSFSLSSPRSVNFGKHHVTNSHSSGGLSNSLFISVYLLCCCSCLVAKSCPTLCDPTDCSPPGSSVHGILQARMLEWVAISSSRGSNPGTEPSSSAWQVDSLPLSHQGSSIHLLIY